MSRPPTRRKPLADATARVNNTAHPHVHPHAHPHAHHSSPIPHHESLKPDGNLNSMDSHAGEENAYARRHRISAVVPGTGAESNRNSHVSTSTNNRNSHVSTSTNNSGSRRKTHVGPWRLGRTLGRGATGRVRLAKHAVTGQYAAIKIVSKASATMVQSSSLKGKDMMNPAVPDGVRQMPFGIEREVVIMKLIEHPNIVSLYDVWENRGELYLVLEYIAGGELFDYVVQAGRLEEMEAVRYFRQIIAALTYCHTFNICHRDLKPENILLDQNKNIKIADFGMAALQPSNSMLRTACGSPHYAPPEIVKGQRYNGNKADIWSCGVILFVMLCGYTPFDDENVRALLDKVRDGWFAMPEPLSEEAKDLIWRILEVDPRRRISIDQIWRHPLLKKYEALDPLARVTDMSCPPIPSVETVDHPIRRRSDIDAEILRNLQTLWHGEQQDVIIQRLLSPDSNQEKVFYCLLMKYREDRLEDYQGTTGLEYSASDYHIGRPPPPQPRRSPSSRQLHSQAYAQTRRRSQFSIVSNDLDRRASYVEDGDDPKPRTAATPKAAVATPKAERPQTSRSRAGSVQSKTSRTSRTSRSRPKTGQTRTKSRSSVASTARSARSTHAGAGSTPPRKRLGSSTTYASKSSLGSRSGTPGVKRPSSAHKRGVSFSRSQKTGVRKSGRTVDDEPPVPAIPAGALPKVAVQEARGSSPTSTALAAPPAIPRARKTAVPESGRKVQTQSRIWRDEARKISNELEKFCDEAFNRSSASSSSRTADTTDRRNYESPVSSVSASGSPVTSYAKAVPIAQVKPVPPRARSPGRTRSPARARSPGPIPGPTLQSADSFTEAQLAQTRERLLQRARQGVPEASQGYLDEVIAHLDRLMQPSSHAGQLESGRRTASATPNCKSPTQSGYLSAISEEEQHKQASPEQAKINRLLERNYHGYRAASEPLGRTASQRPTSPSRRNRPNDDRETIRVVEGTPAPAPPPTPITPIAPLNVRKRSGQYAGAEGSRQSSASYASGSTPPPPPPTAVPSRQVSNEGRKRGWFKRAVTTDDAKTYTGYAGYTDPTPWESMKGPPEIKINGVATGWSDTVPYESHAPGPAPGQAPGQTQGQTKRKTSAGKKGFLRIFGRKDSKEKLDLSISTADDDTEIGRVRSRPRPPTPGWDIMEDDVDLDPDMGDPVDSASQTQVAPQRNWLTRFLHIKPASKILCFDTSKMRARREMLNVLRDWRKYGLRNISMDKQRNVIYGRVDEQNFLHIKPVSFAAEIFTVLEHGKRANLAIARFTQEKGAASSFHKVVDTLDTVLHHRGLLVQDAKRKRAMVRVVDG